MATFLILPPRELLEHAVTEFAGRILPGFPAPAALWERIVDELVTPFESESDGPMFVLHREDLADSDVRESLVDGFGAQTGDRVVEIDTPRQSGPGRSRSWKVTGVRQSAIVV